jgi:Xaa-Pro dipeptidase
MPRMSHAEPKRRWGNLQTKVAENGLDAFLVSARESIYYLTGIVCEPLERPLFLLVRRDGPPALLVPALERDHIRSAANVGRVEVYREHPAPAGQGWDDKLHKMLDGATEIGIEPSLRVEIADELSAIPPRTKPLVEELRVVKSPAEIEMIRRAARYADLGVRRLLASSYYGSSVAEGFVETRSVTKRIIGESQDFNPLLTKVLMGTWAAPGSAQPHSIPKLHDRLRGGPHVALVLTTVDGYSAECERTYFTSRPTPEIRQAFDAVMQARRIAFDMVRPGVPCAEIDAAVNEFLRRGGYGDNLLHRTGHGLGIAYHAEAPWLAEGSPDVLAAGMVLSIEPGVYFPGVGGVRHSDTVLVTGSGGEYLTRYPRDLDQLTITGWKPLARIRGALLRRSLRLGRTGVEAAVRAAAGWKWRRP